RSSVSTDGGGWTVNVSASRGDLTGVLGSRFAYTRPRSWQSLVPQPLSKHVQHIFKPPQRRSSVSTHGGGWTVNVSASRGDLTGVLGSCFAYTRPRSWQSLVPQPLSKHVQHIFKPPQRRSSVSTDGGGWTVNVSASRGDLRGILGSRFAAPRPRSWQSLVPQPLSKHVQHIFKPPQRRSSVSTDGGGWTVNVSA